MNLTKYPWRLLPEDFRHWLAPYALRLLCRFYRLHVYSWRSFSWKGLDFPNPLGLAAGVDKNVQNILDCWKLGAGFLEIGTVTPQPEKPHPKSILHYTSWNFLGFPSQGLDNVKKNLKRYARPYHTPIFLNLEKNRETPLEKASEDYKILIRQLVDHADAFVINMSSQNMKDLKTLQSKNCFSDFLGPILDTIKAQEHVRPTLLRLSLDDSDELFISNIQMSQQLGIDGWILTNTTEQHPSHIPFPKHGELLSQSLKQYSEHRLNLTINCLGKERKKYLIVSAGDIMTPEDIESRLNKGADLVQVYSTLIFNKPWFFKEVADYLPLQRQHL